jgi:hypothetical protein
MRSSQQPSSELGLRWRPQLRRTGMIAVGALVVGVVFAACGGGPSTPGVATGSTTTTSRSAGGATHATGLLAYSSCMRSHGVPSFPDPSGSGGIPKQGVISAEGAVSSSQVTVAQNACVHLLPAGGSLSGHANQTVSVQDQQYYLNAVACMRAHGITNFPDPVFSGGGVSFTQPPGIDTSSPQFIQANQICRRLIPAGLPDSGSGG